MQNTFQVGSRKTTIPDNLSPLLVNCTCRYYFNDSPQSNFLSDDAQDEVGAEQLVNHANLEGGDLGGEEKRFKTV